MNYLIVEGYKDAAEHFSVESGLEASVDFGSIRERMEIRNAVEAGNIELAIEKVNDLDPEVGPCLPLHLHCLFLLFSSSFSLRTSFGNSL